MHRYTCMPICMNVTVVLLCVVLLITAGVQVFYMCSSASNINQKHSDTNYPHLFHSSTDSSSRKK